VAVGVRGVWCYPGLPPMISEQAKLTAASPVVELAIPAQVAPVAGL
jgi:hypothetical protein